jgi:hypothetical protein
MHVKRVTGPLKLSIEVLNIFLPLGSVVQQSLGDLSGHRACGQVLDDSVCETPRWSSSQRGLLSSQRRLVISEALLKNQS